MRVSFVGLVGKNRREAIKGDQISLKVVKGMREPAGLCLAPKGQPGITQLWQELYTLDSMAEMDLQDPGEENPAENGKVSTYR